VEGVADLLRLREGPAISGIGMSSGGIEGSSGCVFGTKSGREDDKDCGSAERIIMVQDLKSQQRPPHLHGLEQQG
jgi:hypothetical protein